MAKKPTEGQRKIIEFDAPTWHALNLLSRESMKSFRGLADEAFRTCCTSMGGRLI
jgi:DNA mismatch repair ATPase MutS